MIEKTIHRTTRFPLELMRVISNIAEEHKCSVSDIIRLLVRNSLDNIDESLITNELRLFTVRQEQKSTNAQLYLVKNMYKRILDMAMSSYFITKSINMGAINLILDLYVKEFELYDDKTKKIIGTDFKMTVKRLRDQNFLLDQSQTINKLKMIS